MALARRIAAVSVSTADFDRVRQLVDQARDKLSCKWLWSPEADADVVLIDVESISGHMDWLRARSSGRPIVCLSSHAGAEYDVVLPRPIGLAGVVAALNRIDETLGGGAPVPTSAPAPAAGAVAPTPAAPARAPVPTSSTTASPAPAAGAPRAGAGQAKEKPTPPRAGPTIQPVTYPAKAPPDPPMQPATYPSKGPPAPAAAPSAKAPPEPMAPRELTLADYCAVEALPQPARLVRGDHPALTIDATADCYYGPAALKPLLPYCQGTIERSEWQSVSATVMQGLRESGSAQPLPRLLWLYTLANSNGQLLPGLDLNARYRLAKWPQIEREFPKHFRIATIMMKGPATLAEIAEQSGASLADVSEFINAYTVVGVAEVEGGMTGPEAQRGLLARLRGRGRR